MKPLYLPGYLNPVTVFNRKFWFVALLLMAALGSKAATVVSIVRGNANPTNTTSVGFTVTFSNDVSGLSVSNFSLVTTGTATGNITGLSGSGKIYTVTVTGISGDGTLAARLTNSTGITPTISTALPFAGQTYTVDNTVPQAATLYMQSNNPNYAIAYVGNTVTLVFGANEPTTQTVNIGGHNIIPVSTGPNTFGGESFIATYTLTASDPPGRISFKVVFTDLAGNQSTYTDQAAGDDIEFSLSAAIVSINLQNPATAITKATSLIYRVTFALDVSGVSPSLFSLTKTDSANGIIGSITPVSGSIYDVTVNNVTGDGTLTLNLVSGTGIAPVLNSTLPFAGQAYTIDNSPPSVSIGNPSTLNTSVGPITFLIYCGDANLKDVTLAAADVTLIKTGTATGNVTVSGGGTGNGRVYTVTISNITGSGTMGISLPAGLAFDYAGNLSRGPVVSPNFSVVSANATLNSLTLGGGGVLSPVFDKAVTTYYVTVPNNFNTTTVTPVLSDIHSTVKVNNTAIASGATSGPIPIGVGNNQILTTVTAQDGVTQTIYTAYVYRAASGIATLSNLSLDGGLTLTPVFNKNSITYSASAPNGTATVNITPTATDATATLTVNGLAVNSGSTTNIPLVIGLNDIVTVVTAQDGITIKTYTTKVTRAKATSTINFAALPAKVYGDADFLPQATSSNSNIAITYASNNPAVATIVNGKIHIVGAGNAGITASQAGDANNNAANDAVQQLKVNTVAITITADAKTKTYGQADPAFTYKITAGTLVGNDTFSGALSRAPGQNAGNYAITLGTLSLGSNYTLTYTGASITINKAAIAVTAADKSKLYGQPDPALTYSISAGSLVGNDAFTGTLTRTAGENVGSYTITQGTLALGTNYNISFANAKLTVGKIAVTVTAAAKSKIYGQTDPPLTYSITSGALIGTDAFTGTLKRETGEAAGDHNIIQGTLALNNNYNLTYLGAKLTISIKTLTITVVAKSKAYGAANPMLTLSYTGFVNGDNSQSFTKQPIVSTTAVAGSAVGAYPITVGGAVIPNYQITYVPAILTVSKAQLTVTAADKSRLYSAANPPFTLSYIGFVNNDSATALTTQPTATCTATVTDKPGKYPITVAGGVSSNYSFKYINGSLTIVPLSNADLEGLTLSKGELTPTFSKTTNEYTTVVAGVVKTINLTPVLSDKNATVKINGTLVASGNSSPDIDLNVGNNNISIQVTAQNGITQNNYTVIVNRGVPLADVKPTNILTPNGDGKNDTWLIPDIDLFPDNNVTVFDRSGRKVYYKAGYANDWDGSLNGSPLSEGTYYYLVYLGKGITPLNGYITLLRRK